MKFEPTQTLYLILSTILASSLSISTPSFAKEDDEEKAKEGGPKLGQSGDGSDGIEFQVVHTSIEDNCNSLALKGTSRFRGMGFAMPHTLLSMDKHRVPVFRIRKLTKEEEKKKGDNEKKGAYYLKVGIFFPRFTEGMKARAEQSNTKMHFCDYPTTLQAINKAISDPEEKIKYLANLPVKQISVTIPGLGTKTIGENTGDEQSEVSLFDYVQSDQEVDFPIPNEDVLTKLRRDIRAEGKTIYVNFKFSARASNGYFSASISTQSIAKELNSTVKAGTLIASAEFQTALKSAIRKVGVKIDSEQGQNLNPDNTNGSGNSIMDQVVTGIMTAIQNAVPQFAQGNPDYQNGSNGYPSENQRASSEDEGSPSGVDGILKKVGLKQVDAKAAVNYLKNTDSLKFRYANVGPRADYIYRTKFKVQGNLHNSGRKNFVLTTTHDPVTVPEPLRENTKYSLVPVKAFKEVLKYEPMVHYYSQSEMLNNLRKMRDLFPTFRVMPLNVTWKNLFFAIFYDARLGSYFTSSGEERAYDVLGWNYKGYSTYFGYIIQTPYYLTAMKAKDVEDPTKGLRKDMIDSNELDGGFTEADIKNLPVAIRFNNTDIGKTYRLADLMTPNNLWEGGFDPDKQAVWFKPKRYLGEPQLEILEKPPYQTIETKIFFEEDSVNFLNRSTIQTEVDCPDQKAMRRNGHCLGDKPCKCIRIEPDPSQDETNPYSGKIAMDKKTVKEKFPIFKNNYFFRLMYDAKQADEVSWTLPPFPYVQEGKPQLVQR